MKRIILSLTVVLASLLFAGQAFAQQQQSLILNKTSITLKVGQSYKLTVKGKFSLTNKPQWSSLNEKIAKVSSTGKVSAIAVGRAKIVAKFGKKVGYCVVTVVTADDSGAGNTSVPGAYCDVVDLGLSVKWATCNLGARKPGEFGDYFAWGETQPKKYFDFDNLKYSVNAMGFEFTKYVTNKGSGSVDGRSVLEPSDDAAYKACKAFATPTIEEWEELVTKCKWTLGNQDGNRGYIVTGPSGKSIFLPAAGFYYCERGNQVGVDGYYWSASLNKRSNNAAWKLMFDRAGQNYTSSGSRSAGLTIRPVCR